MLLFISKVLPVGFKYYFMYLFKDFSRNLVTVFKLVLGVNANTKNCYLLKILFSHDWVIRRIYWFKDINNRLYSQITIQYMIYLTIEWGGGAVTK